MRIIDSFKKQWRWLLITILSIVISYNAFIRYIDFDRSNFQIIFDGRFDVGSLSLFIFYMHIFTSIVALVVGPFNFWNWLLVNHKNVHRWVGRTYFYLGIFPGAVSGFIVAQGTTSGLTGVYGFSFLAILWGGTGIIALVAILKGDVQSHRRWMFRNFALTLAAVTLRLWLPGLIIGQILISGTPEDEALRIAYTVIPWMCWVPNIIIAEWVIERWLPPPSRNRKNRDAVQTT
ncbi:MAG: DUF2306 domain-containing protein [Chloroflexota bacterium]